MLRAHAGVIGVGELIFKQGFSLAKDDNFISRVVKQFLDRRGGTHE